MPKHSTKKKTPKDINQLAAYIVEESTKEAETKKSNSSSNNQDTARG